MSFQLWYSFPHKARCFLQNLVGAAWLSSVQHLQPISAGPHQCFSWLDWRRVGAVTASEYWVEYFGRHRRLFLLLYFRGVFLKFYYLPPNLYRNTLLSVNLLPSQERVSEAPGPVREGEGGRAVPGGDPGRGLGPWREEAGAAGQQRRNPANRKGQTESPERSHVP